MPRDLDLIRQLLLAIEASPGTHAYLFDLCHPFIERGGRQGVLEHQLSLCEQAGLLTWCDDELSLTWNGHEFLDLTRTSRIWEAAKALLAARNLGMSFDLLRAAATDIALSEMGLMSRSRT